MPTISKGQIMTAGVVLGLLALVNNVKQLAPVKKVIGLGKGIL